MEYVILFLEFFKTGLFSIGGGLATLPFLYEMAENYDWFTRAELLDMIAISESTPGPIGVNMATYVGFRMGGVPGAVLATAGLVLPSFLVIILVAKVMAKFRENKYMDYAFYGLKPAVTGLIAVAGISMFLEIFYMDEIATITTNFRIQALNYKAMILFIVVILAKTKWKKIHPTFWVLIGAVAGIVFKM